MPLSHPKSPGPDVSDAEVSVAGVLRRVVHDPLQYLVWRWNWKAAVLSAAMRGAIFFTTNLRVGPRAAFTALAVDVAFRVPLSGACAALTEAFRWASPPGQAFVAAMVVVPAIAHLVEFTVHWWAGTPVLATSIDASVALSALSTLFNLFAMRQGVLVVTVPARSLWDDVRRLPLLYVRFAIEMPVAAGRGLVKWLRRHRD